MSWLKDLFRTPTRDELVIAAYRKCLGDICLSEYRFSAEEQFRIIKLLKLTLKGALEKMEENKIKELQEVANVLQKLDY